MITGNGLDIVEIKRVRAALERRPQLLFRIFNERELKYFNKRNNAVATIAGCFAAKEAAVKAVGGGYIRDVELDWDESGMPSVRMRGRDDLRLIVSITHSREYAAASVISMEVESR